MKKILILSLLLAACSKSDRDTSGTSWIIEHNNKTYYAEEPDLWRNGGRFRTSDGKLHVISGAYSAERIK